MKPNELDALLEDCLESRLTELDARKLSALLEQSAEARARYWQTASIHGLLEHSLQSASLRVVTGQTLPRSPRINRWLSWRPLAAAAAGLAVGLFSASVLFAYVVPLTSSVSLMDDSFEGSTKLVSKVSLEPGVWRGDHAAVVEAERLVMPENGRHMLRFLRSESEGRPRAAGGHIADVYRLIDVRAHRHEFSDGGAIVQASASVNAAPFPEHEKFGCAISIYALDSESVPESASYIGTALETDANAMARSSRTNLDRDPARWQRLTTEMRLPADTEFLVVRLHINQLFVSDGTSVFTGSYADDVRVTLSSRPPLP